MDKVIESSIPCNLCGGREVEIVGTMDRDQRPLQTVICRTCGLAWTDPRPSEDEIAKFYAEKYRAEYKGSYRPKLRHIYRAGRIARERYQYIADLLTESDAVLDIGSSSGEFAYLMRGLGFDVSGIEPNQGYASYSIDEFDLPVSVGMAQEFQRPSDSLNVVTMHHVFEHLEDPAGLLRDLHSALRENGIVVIEVPNSEATSMKPSNRFHRGHLYHFNLPALETIGRSAGYKIIRSGASPDSVVIRAVMQKTENVEPAATLAGNFERVSRVLLGFKDRDHYLTVYPYLRRMQKLRNWLRETAVIQRRRTGRAILDALVLSLKARP